MIEKSIGRALITAITMKATMYIKPGNCKLVHWHVHNSPNNLPESPSAALLSATFKSVKQKTISNTAIKRYIEYFCDSFLIDSALRYDVKREKIIKCVVNLPALAMGSVKVGKTE